MVAIRTTALACLSAALVLLVGACNDGAEVAETEFASVRTFVGDVDDELFIAFDVFEPTDPEEPRAVAAYLCDGDGTSTWIGTRFSGDDAALIADDTEVIVSFATPSPNDIRPASAAGTVSIGGGAHVPFAAVEVPSDGDANLYRAEGTDEGRAYVGGWIVLQDGRQRGALTADGEIVEHPVLQLPSGEIDATVDIGTACICFPPVHSNPCCMAGL